MSLQMRQGTVYREKSGAKRFILLNHNPMALQSLRFWSAGPEEAFDLGKPEHITIDELITLRNSGDYEDLGDIPQDVLEQMISALIAGNVLPEEENRLLRGILQAPEENSR